MSTLQNLTGDKFSTIFKYYFNTQKSTSTKGQIAKFPTHSKPFTINYEKRKMQNISERNLLPIYSWFCSGFLRKSFGRLQNVST